MGELPAMCAGKTCVQGQGVEPGATALLLQLPKSLKKLGRHRGLQKYQAMLWMKWLANGTKKSWLQAVY